MRIERAESKHLKFGIPVYTSSLVKILTHLGPEDPRKNATCSDHMALYCATYKCEKKQIQKNRRAK